MIISDKNHESNRRNAQHSTGPTTPEGKKAASLNAVTYGLRTRSLIIHGENIADYWRLWDGLETEWQPETPTEPLYLEGMSPPQWQPAPLPEQAERAPGAAGREGQKRGTGLRDQPADAGTVRSAGPHRQALHAPGAFLHHCHARIEAVTKGAQSQASRRGQANQSIRDSASSAPKRRDVGSYRGPTSLLRPRRYR